MSRWNLIRLELDRTPEFPGGSASRAYMLCAPLDDAGVIDEAALARQPGLATVRRFWPNEPDRSGFLVRKGGDWVISFVPGGGGESFVLLDSHPLRLGGPVALREPDGSVRPFRIVRMQPDGIAS